MNNVEMANMNNVELANMNNVELTSMNNVELANMNNVELTSMNNVQLTNMNNVELASMNYVQLANMNNVEPASMNNVELHGQMNNVEPDLCFSRNSVIGSEPLVDILVLINSYRGKVPTAKHVDKFYRKPWKPTRSHDWRYPAWINMDHCLFD